MSELENSLRKIIREEIERAMPRDYRGHFPQPPALAPGQCAVCGGYHGEGMMCPRLRPTTESGAW